MSKHQVLILCDDEGKTIYVRPGMMTVIRKPKKRD